VKEKFEIFIDGASKGNPGLAGVGVVILKNNKVVKEFGRYIGYTTNNVAEYVALIFSLQAALILKAKHVSVKTDSQLLAKQINKEYKVKNPNIKFLFEIATHAITGFKHFEITHIVREKNQNADFLATQAVKEQVMFSARAGKMISPTTRRAGKSGLKRAAHPDKIGTPQLTFLG